MARKLEVGDKVQVRKDISEEELTKILGSHGLVMRNALELQRRGELTVKDIQECRPGIKGDDWDSITLEGIGYYWPIELFEPVNKPNVVKSKEEQVQEDILTLKRIAERYGIQDSVDGIVEWLRDFGQEYLRED